MKLLFSLLCLQQIIAQTVYLPEEVDVGTVVTRLTQSGNYQLYNPNDHYFQISKNGIVTTKARIDRESLPFNNPDKRYELTIKRDNNNYIKLEIGIIDINDNSPLFEDRIYTMSFSENTDVGHEEMLPNAIDLDFGVNSTQGYRFKSGNIGNTFEIVKISLPMALTFKLRVAKALDREERSEFNLEIVAYDGGNPQKTDTLMLKVLVEDENDCTPEFRQDEYSVEIKEDVKRGATIAEVTADDCDAGKNAALTYSLQSLQKNSENPFQINKSTGKITLLGTLDYESMSDLAMQVKVTDGGVIPRSATVLVRVLVVDVNDNDPEIRILYSSSTDPVVRVYEDAKKDSPVTTFSVTDNDSGRNGEVTCDMSSKNGMEYFKLSKDNFAENTWNVKVKKSPSRKVSDRYTLSVTCSDLGAPEHRISSKSFDVYVLDVNDHYPIFSQTSYERRIKENTPAGTEVAQVYAEDDDDGDFGKVSYRIESVTAQDSMVDLKDAFEIRPNGVITNKIKLDREKTPKITINVLAIDGGKEPQGPHMTKATVILEVLDVNDNKPTFSNKVYEANIKNNKPIGSHVLQVKAHDYDDGKFGAVKYNMSRDLNTPEYFKIHPTTGIISVASPLPNTDFTIIALIVYATDNDGQGLTGQCKVNIQIFGENKYSPSLSKEIYKIKVKENILVPSVILKVEASDIDPSEYFSKVLYELQGSATNKFSINSDTGELSITRPLDFETTQIHRFTVRAYNHEDGTVSIKEDTAVVEVVVEDVDDEPPRFQFKRYNLTAHSQDDNGTVIEIIRAIDPDSPSSAVTYRLIRGNENSYFKLKSTPEGAHIIVNGDLGFMEDKTISMVLEAQDNNDQSINVDQTILYIDIKPGKGVYATMANRTWLDRFLPFIIGGAVFILLIFIVTIVVICNRSKKQRSQFTLAKLPNYDHYDNLDFDEQVGLEPDTIKTYNIDGGGECDRLSAFEALTSQLNSLQYDYIDKKHYPEYSDKKLLDSEGYFSLSDPAFNDNHSPYTNNENKDFMNSLINTQNHYSNMPVKTSDKYVPLSPPPPPPPGGGGSQHSDFVRSLPPINNQFLPLSPDLDSPRDEHPDHLDHVIEPHPKSSVTSLLSAQSRPNEISRLPTSLLDNNDDGETINQNNSDSSDDIINYPTRTSNLSLDSDR